MIDNPSSEKLKQEQKERIEAYAEHYFIMERLKIVGVNSDGTYDCETLDGQQKYNSIEWKRLRRIQ